MNNVHPSTEVPVSPQGQTQSSRTKSIAATAALAAALAACGGGGGSSPDADAAPVEPTTPVTPTTPVAPPEIAVVYNTREEAPVGKTGVVLTDIANKAQQSLVQAYVSQTSTQGNVSCTLRQESDGTYTILLSPIVPTTLEADDTCEIKGTGEANENVTITLENRLDQLAPRVTKPVNVVNGYTEGSTGSVDLMKLLGTITDASATTITVAPTDLPPGYSYNAEKHTLSWTGVASMDTIVGYVADAAGNKTEIKTLVNLQSVTPVIPPTPTTPTCPPGTVYNPTVGCI